MEMMCYIQEIQRQLVDSYRVEECISETARILQRVALVLEGCAPSAEIPLLLKERTDGQE